MSDQPEGADYAFEWLEQYVDGAQPSDALEFNAPILVEYIRSLQGSEEIAALRREVRTLKGENVRLAKVMVEARQAVRYLDPAPSDFAEGVCCGNRLRNGIAAADAAREDEPK